MVNKVILIGNLGADPETRETKSGSSVGNLRIATNERRKIDGEWADHTEWHRVTVFGKTAENCEKYLSKGRQVYVEGRIQTRQWKDKEGNDKYTTEIVADQVRFLSGASEGGDYQRSQPSRRREEPTHKASTTNFTEERPAPRASARKAVADNEWDEEIPF